MRVKRIMYSVLLAGALMFCFGTTTFASENWAGITALLKADQSTVTTGFSADKVFQADAMYGETASNSKYSIMYETRGCNSIGGQTYREALITLRPGYENTSSIDSDCNYHSLTLTGKNGLDTVKGCIGYGYVNKK